ncbi:putative hexokinase protein [Lasiodiplodia theobromae]|uniref:Phosphotransferase n=1 Tax=Lasiodiplodia hormozganensis TaxID=869390 RepID=A0AA39YXA3_9PEZI|nr:putative hexokinase protein [Lasiodiplodia theobromae]KAK0660239.1 Hexokinase [Lasiodiplodia hormozganensis]
MVGLGPRKPPSRKGSMADVPKDLLETMKRLEEQFTVPQAKLKEITDHFVKELEKGLSKEGGSIPMIPTWVMNFPTGDETGTYLALDMGGTNLRVCEVTLTEEKGEFDIIQSKYRMPQELKTGTAEELWDYIADCLQQFVEYHHEGEDIKSLPLGFTFSYPASQDFIDHGVLQRWTKGFDIDGVEGKDVVPPFAAALKERGVPINVTALVNDTTGTLIASAYTDPRMKIGCIFGTGCNAAYMEDCGSIPKLDHLDLNPKDLMGINCEWGAFDNEHVVLPRTKYDIIIDKESPRPGQQSFEKMIAGLYLGEVFRLVILDLHEDPHCHLFEGQDVTKLKKPYTMDSSFLATIEEDPWENLQETADLFANTLGLVLSKPELELCRRLAELIGTRAARLSACGVAAICKKKGWTECHVGADGSVFNKYPHFKARGAQALREIFDWPKGKRDPIEIVPAEDGSGVGAALIAALTLKRVAEGNNAGIRDPKAMLEAIKP